MIWFFEGQQYIDWSYDGSKRPESAKEARVIQSGFEDQQPAANQAILEIGLESRGLGRSIMYAILGLSGVTADDDNEPQIIQITGPDSP